MLVEGGTGTTRDVGRGDLPIREASDGQILIPNLRHVNIKSIPQFDKLYAQVMRFRSVSSTKLNHASSRSHAILTIGVSYRTDPQAPIINGKCVLIDLAGSENNKKTGNESNKERMKESVEINQSLLALRKVVRSLNTGDHRIPYRDSKLTRILSDSLGGTSAGLVICNVAPGASQYRDTMNTLTFGSHSRNVENKAPSKAHDGSDRKFLLPSLSLYQYHSKSTPHLPSLTTSPTVATDAIALKSVPSRSPIKLSWTRQRLSDGAFRAAQSPACTAGAVRSIGSTADVVVGIQSPSKALSPSSIIRNRKFSHCLSSPSSIIKTPESFKRLHHRASSSNLLGLRNHQSHHHTHHPAVLADQSCLEIDRRVEEAMRKNLDEIVQNRVDALLSARLRENGFTSPKNPSISDVSDDSPIDRVVSDSVRFSNTYPKSNSEEDEELLRRISKLEKQFVNISSMLQNVTTSSRPESTFTKIPRPKLQ